MKTTFQLFALLVATTCLLLLGNPDKANAQEKKKFNIYLNLKKNGKTTIVDTSFATQQEMETFMKSQGLEIPEPPPAPDVKGLPNPPPAPPAVPEINMPDKFKHQYTVIVDSDDMNLSPEEQEKMNKEIELEMLNAKENLKQATQNLKDAKIDLEFNQKDLEKAMEELKNIKIEINDGDMDTMIIRSIELNDSDTDKEGSKKEIHIIKGNPGEFKRTMILRNDSLDNGKSVVIIRKPDVEEKMEKANVDQEPAEELLTPSSEVSKTNTPVSDNYELQVTDFKLFPNPSEGKVHVSFQLNQPGNVELRLMDGSGKILADDRIETTNGFVEKEFNLEGKSKGTYLLQIRQGDHWKHQKIVIK